MYLHEDHYYLISNYAVARNPIFCDMGMQLHFRNKMRFYLEPISEILAFKIKDNEFQILVKLKQRDEFEDYYRSKMKGIQDFIHIPESTYIFSQAMSNLQVSLVKKFNAKYYRKGTLMAGRFKRELLTSKEDIIDLIMDLNNGISVKRHSGVWAECAMKRIEGMTSRGDYEVLKMDSKGKEISFWNELKNNLVGDFTSPSENLYNPILKYHERRLFNAFCQFIE